MSRSRAARSGHSHVPTRDAFAAGAAVNDSLFVSTTELTSLSERRNVRDVGASREICTVADRNCLDSFTCEDCENVFEREKLATERRSARDQPKKSPESEKASDTVRSRADGKWSTEAVKEDDWDSGAEDSGFEAVNMSDSLGPSEIERLSEESRFPDFERHDDPENRVEMLIALERVKCNEITFRLDSENRIDRTTTIESLFGPDRE